MIDLGLVVPSMKSPQNTSVLAKSTTTHAPDYDLPQFTLSALPLGSSTIRSRDHRQALRSHYYGRRPSLQATAVVRDAASAGVTKTKRQKKHARRLLAIQRDANRRAAEERERYAKERAQEDLDYGQISMNEGVLGTPRESAGMRFARCKLTFPNCNPILAAQIS